MRIRLIPVVILLFGPATYAQTSVSERRTISASVLNRDGSKVSGLTAANFRGELHGQPVKILSCTEDTNPRRIALMVDVSGRVPGGHNWELTWAAARDFITNMMPTNAVAVLVLGREREQRREFSQDKDKLLLEIEESEKETRRRVDSARGLESLIPETARSLSPAGWGDAIYVITYRGVSGVGRDRVSLDEQLAASGVRVFGLWLGDTLRPGPVGWRRRNETPAGLDRLARLSGGTVVSVDTELKREQVPMIVRPLYAAMTDVYRIEVEFERPVGRHDEWKLEVVDQQGYKLKGVEVAYPTLLVPPSPH